MAKTIIARQNGNLLIKDNTLFSNYQFNGVIGTKTFNSNTARFEIVDVMQKPTSIIITRLDADVNTNALYTIKLNLDEYNVSSITYGGARQNGIFTENVGYQNNCIDYNSTNHTLKVQGVSTLSRYFRGTYKFVVEY